MSEKLKKLCVVDIETTGLNPEKHEITEICLLPLKDNLEIDQEFAPLHIKIRLQTLAGADPYNIRRCWIEQDEPERISGNLQDWILDYLVESDLLWIPIGHNYGQFDRAFISKLIGEELYRHFFYYHYHDSMILANVINVKEKKFESISLQNLAAHYDIDPGRAHTALDDCRTTLAVYQSLLGEINGH